MTRAMIPARDEELLSAYLDGELTADEQARVEALLAVNADYRQLHEELRALRVGLESLYRHTVGHDLAARVLRQSELATLSGRVDAGPAAAPPDGQPAPAARLAEPRGRRPWIYAALAVAAAVLVALFSNPPWNNDEPNLARGTKRPAAAGETATAQPALEAAKDFVADEPPAKQWRPQGDLAPKRETTRETEGVGAARQTDAVRPRPEVVKPAVPEETPQVAPRVAEPAAAPADAPAPPVPAPRLPRPMAAKAALGGFGAQATDHDLVVHCRLTRQALEEGQLERLLAKHQIPLDASAAAGEFRQPRAEPLGKSAEKVVPAERPAPGGVVLVEASVEKVDAILAELRDAPSKVVALDPRPLNRAVDQRHYFSFRRAAPGGPPADGAANSDPKLEEGETRKAPKPAARSALSAAAGGERNALAGKAIARAGDRAVRLSLSQEEIKRLGVEQPSRSAQDKAADELAGGAAGKAELAAGAPRRLSVLFVLELAAEQPAAPAKESK